MKTIQRLLSAFCATGSVVMIGSVRSFASAAIAPDSGVRLYTGENYSGTELVFSPRATYNGALASEYRNQISSLQVPPGFKVTLIDTAGRRTYLRSFGPGDYTSVGDSINNKADFVVVSAA